MNSIILALMDFAFELSRWNCLPLTNDCSTCWLLNPHSRHCGLGSGMLCCTCSATFYVASCTYVICTGALTSVFKIIGPILIFGIFSYYRPIPISFPICSPIYHASLFATLGGTDKKQFLKPFALMCPSELNVTLWRWFSLLYHGCWVLYVCTGVIQELHLKLRDHCSQAPASQNFRPAPGTVCCSLFYGKDTLSNSVSG